MGNDHVLGLTGLVPDCGESSCRHSISLDTASNNYLLDAGADNTSFAPTDQPSSRAATYLKAHPGDDQAAARLLNLGRLGKLRLWM